MFEAKGISGMILGRDDRVDKAERAVRAEEKAGDEKINAGSSWRVDQLSSSRMHSGAVGWVAMVTRKWSPSPLDCPGT